MFQAPGPQISELTFLKVTKTLWPPESSSASSSTSSVRPNITAGTQSWPFHFPLPWTFDSNGETFLLPPTYADKAYISYMIHVIVKRDFLHSDIM